MRLILGTSECDTFLTSTVIGGGEVNDEVSRMLLLDVQVGRIAVVIVEGERRRYSRHVKRR